MASLRRNLIEMTQIFRGEKQRNAKQLSAKISSETKYLYISLSSVAYLILIHIQIFSPVKTFHESACFWEGYLGGIDATLPAFRTSDAKGKLRLNPTIL